MPTLILHLLLLLLLLFLLPHHATLFAAGTGGRCNRQCNGGAPVPYPFGFSGDCPILLLCNATTSAALLPRSTPAMQYPVLSFNVTASTFLVAVAPSCNRTARDAQAALTGPGGFAVSYRTGLFLRGAAASCRASGARNGSAGCSVQAGLMTRILRTARCGGTNENSSLTCVSALTDAAPPDSSAAAHDGQGEFVRWDTVRASGCEEALTAAVYGDTLPQGVAASLEFGVAELAWWLDGTCAGAGASSRCAPDATCRDVLTPTSGSGAPPGHRCACRDGTTGDGSAAGDGCRAAAATSFKNSVTLIVAGVLAGVAACTVVILLCRMRRRRSAAGGRYSSAMRLLSEAAAASGVPVYSYNEVARATNGFSHTHRLGTGAYGTVYVGRLPASAPTTLVAIKRLRYRHYYHEDEDDGDAAAAMLLNEIKLVSSVSHPNLVRLLGCCLDRGEQILVYEYVPNGTLSQHLHHYGGGGVLPWRARLGVAAETAAAIAYLHGMRPPSLHRDVKSSNILLGGDLRPKLADFGLSRAGAAADDDASSRSHISTAPQGTPGYVDPEYHQNFHLSDKSDVYSFGVVLLELITAMKVVDFDRRPASEVNLASLALDRIGKGRVNEIVDPTLVEHDHGEEEWVMESVRHVGELAFRCLAFQKDVRPCMSEVAAELGRIRAAAAPVSDSVSQLKPLMTGLQIDVSFDGPAGSAVKKAAPSPVSVHDMWVSDRSSPSTNSSVIMPRFL